MNASGTNRRLTRASTRRSSTGAVLLRSWPPNRRHRDAGQRRALHPFVERRQILGQHVADLILKRLELGLEVLLDGQLLIRRLEVRALQTVREIGDFLHQLRSEANAVLAAAGGAELQE